MDNITIESKFSSANKAIKKIADLQRNILILKSIRDSFVAEYQKRIEEAENIFKEQADELNRAIENIKYDYNLRDFALDNIPKGKKSLKLPEGTIKFTSQPVQFRFKNGDVPNKNSPKLIEFLQTHDPNFIQTNYTADWAGLKKILDFDPDTGDVFFKTTGEIFPDLFGEKPPDKFDVIPKDV